MLLEDGTSLPAVESRVTSCVASNGSGAKVGCFPPAIPAAAASTVTDESKFDVSSRGMLDAEQCASAEPGKVPSAGGGGMMTSQQVQVVAMDCSGMASGGSGGDSVLSLATAEAPRSACSRLLAPCSIESSTPSFEEKISAAFASFMPSSLSKEQPLGPPVRSESEEGSSDFWSVVGGGSEVPTSGPIDVESFLRGFRRGETANTDNNTEISVCLALFLAIYFVVIYMSVPYFVGQYHEICFFQTRCARVLRCCSVKGARLSNDRFE